MNAVRVSIAPQARKLPAKPSSQGTFKWENSLKEEVAALIAPDKSGRQSSRAKDGRLILSGRYKPFPHFPTSELALSVDQVNLLDDMTGWVVKENSKIFKAVLGRLESHGEVPLDYVSQLLRGAKEKATTTAM